MYYRNILIFDKVWENQLINTDTRDIRCRKSRKFTVTFQFFLNIYRLTGYFAVAHFTWPKIFDFISGVYFWGIFIEHFLYCMTSIYIVLLILDGSHTSWMDLVTWFLDFGISGRSVSIVGICHRLKIYNSSINKRRLGVAFNFLTCVNRPALFLVINLFYVRANRNF